MRRTPTRLPLPPTTRLLATRLLTVGLLALALLLGGCAGARLGDERKIEPFATLLRQGDDFGTVTTRQDGAAPGGTPLQIGLVQMPLRHRGSGPLLVLQSGLLADSTSWRFLAPLLAAHYDLLMVDPPGTGASDKPGVETLGETAYSPTWLGRYTLRAVQRWEASRGSTRRGLVLVGHSLGCTSILMAIGDPDLPGDLWGTAGRVQKIVLFQPADVGMRCPSPSFELFESLGDGVMQVGSALGLSRHVVNHAIYDSVVNPRQRAHRQEAEGFYEVVNCVDTRHAAQAMLNRFRPVDARRRPNWPLIRLLEMRYRNVRQPTLLIWGDQDAVLEASSPSRLVHALPNARARHVSDAKHSPHQERPLLCAEWIRAFLEEDEVGSQVVQSRAVPSK